MKKKYFTIDEKRAAHKKSNDKYNHSKQGKQMNSQRRKKYNNLPYIKIRKRQYDLKKLYNITEEYYDILLHEQNYKCAICNKDLTQNKPHIDHDHKTNKVRGLLCIQCNTSLYLLDNPILLQNAQEYLRRTYG